MILRQRESNRAFHLEKQHHEVISVGLGSLAKKFTLGCQAFKPPSLLLHQWIFNPIPISAAFPLFTSCSGSKLIQEN